MTKKEFVLQVVDQLLQNPRKVLAGHGIQAGVLQAITKRPDIMGKLATVLYSLKTAKKGAQGLKKASNFAIKGYKNFPDMNMKAREDIETFIGGLPADDQAKFNNANNIMTILMLPDTNAFVPGQESDEVVEEILTGKSVVLPFNAAVTREYKIAGGIYLVVMIGDSAVRPAEMKIAERKAKSNKLKSNKRTPARIKMELKRKAAKKLEMLGAERSRLQDTAYNTRMQMQQDAALAADLGDDDISYGISSNDMAADIWNTRSKELKSNAMSGLSSSDVRLVRVIKNLLKKGNRNAAKAVMNTMDNKEAVSAYLMNDRKAKIPTSGKAIVSSRKSAIRNQIKALVTRNEQLMLDFSLSPAQKKTSIRSMMSKNNSAIKALRAKLGTYKNLDNAGVSGNKAAMLQKVNSAIEANIATGASINQALNAAIAKLDATPQQKQLIKQQVIQQVAQGIPMQYAVQQSIQQNVQNISVDDLIGDTTLAGNYSIQELLNSL